MNESSSASSSVQSPTLPLRSLQEIIHNRIIQKKKEMHPSHNKAYLESVQIEIENNPMGIDTDTYAAVTISNHQELTVHYGCNYSVKPVCVYMTQIYNNINGVVISFAICII
jgi:hypothetical protein